MINNTSLQYMYENNEFFLKNNQLFKSPSLSLSLLIVFVTHIIKTEKANGFIFFITYIYTARRERERERDGTE